ncbi:hypothetical protein MY11210_005604 [Beauveria gryllotalpidicola]
MKSTFALVGAYAALASAFSPGRYLHFPRGNGTTTTAASEGAITTMVVKETRTTEITSCSASVTNCPAGKPEITGVPASDLKVVKVTETVVLTTVVCPVSEASDISEQVVAQHKSTSSALPVEIANVTATGSPTPLGPLTMPTANVPATNPPTPLGSLTTPSANATAPGALTVLTVKVTRIVTRTSCSASVTNCPTGKPEMSAIPESDLDIKVDTETSDLATATCAVSEAADISKEIIAQYSSNSSAFASQTQVPVQTTAIMTTKTPAAAGSKPSNETVTTTATSTSTKTVTITRVSATPTGPASNKNEGHGGVDGNGDKCTCGDASAPATVTVTVAKTTVTETAPCAASTAPGGSNNVGNQSVGNDSKPDEAEATPCETDDAATVEATSCESDDSATVEATSCESDDSATVEATPCETDGTATVEATVTVVPYPANNSTTVTATGGAGPSGFARLRR